MALLWALFAVLVSVQLWWGDSGWARRLVDRRLNATKVSMGLYWLSLLCWTYIWVWRVL